MYPYGAQHCAQLHLSPSPNIGLAGGRGDPDGDLNSPSSLRVSCPWNIDFYSLFKSDRNGPGLSSRRPEVLAYQPWHCNTLKVTRPPPFQLFCCGVTCSRLVFIHIAASRMLPRLRHKETSIFICSAPVKARLLQLWGENIPTLPSSP